MNSARTKGDKIFDLFNVLFMLVMGFIWIYPLWYVLIASFSDVTSVSMGNVIMLPKGFNLESYAEVFRTKNIWTSYGNTIFYAVVGTAINMFLTATAAYPLSKKSMNGCKAITLFMIVSMWFSPGLMPTYLNYKNLGLLNTRAAILLCSAISTFNMVLLRTYFESIPSELEESAKLDGANDLYIFKNIYLPLSIPALITITLYYFVGRWNAYFWTMLLVQDERKISLQVLLRKLVVEMNVNYSQAGNIDFQTTSRETMSYATMIVAVIPMLAVYPFIQKFFIKGIMVGAVKG